MATSLQFLSKFVGRGLFGLDARHQNNFRYVLQRGAAANTAYATADQTVVGTTLAASTYLTLANACGFNNDQAVVGGRKYQLQGRLFVTATASNGIKIDMNAGTATFSKINGVYSGISATAIAASAVTALTSTLSSTATILEVQIDVALEASASGSLGLRFAESANSTGVIVLQGSWLSLTEIPQSETP